jgi:hypothetical protein
MEPGEKDIRMSPSLLIPEPDEEVINVIVALPHSEREIQRVSVIYIDIDKKILVLKGYDNSIIRIVGLPFIVRSQIKSEKK